MIGESFIGQYRLSNRLRHSAGALASVLIVALLALLLSGIGSAPDVSDTVRAGISLPEVDPPAPAATGDTKAGAGDGGAVARFSQAVERRPSTTRTAGPVKPPPSSTAVEPKPDPEPAPTPAPKPDPTVPTTDPDLISTGQTPPDSTWPSLPGPTVVTRPPPTSHDTAPSTWDMTVPSTWNTTIPHTTKPKPGSTPPPTPPPTLPPEPEPRSEQRT